MTDDDKDKKAAHERLVQAVGRQLTDEGLLIEAGFAMFKHMFLPAGVSDAQRDDMRIAFFAGAQHVFRTVTNIMEEGTEPTDADMQRMESINDEIEKFEAFLKAEIARRGIAPQ